MTLAYQEGQRWDEGPKGPGIDVVIPSSRKGHGPYRIIRDAVEGSIFHIPACEAWQHGHYLCRHVSEAVHRSEQPAEVFLAEVRKLFSESAWWADPETAAELCGRIKRLQMEATNQQRANEAGQRAAAERRAFRALPPDEQERRALALLGSKSGEAPA